MGEWEGEKETKDRAETATRKGGWRKGPAHRKAKERDGTNPGRGKTEKRGCWESKCPRMLEPRGGLMRA